MKKRFDRIYLELSNVCNFKCPFCATSKRNACFMPLEILKKVISQAALFTDELCLHVLGEPLLYPELESVFDLCQNFKLKINLVTNGSLLCEKVSTLLSYSNIIKKLSISIHSYQYKDNGNTSILKKIIPTIKLLTNNNLIIELRLMENSDKNIDFNRKIAKLISKEFKVDILKKETSIKLAKNLYLVYKNIFTWPEETKEVNINTSFINSSRMVKEVEALNKNKRFCLAGKSHIAILSNGTVVLCCLDCDGSISLGNVNNQSLKEIIESEKFIKINKEFEQGRASQALCINCSYNKKK